MSAKTLSLLISAACTVAGLLSGLASGRAEAAPVAPHHAAGPTMARAAVGWQGLPGPTAQG